MNTRIGASIAGAMATALLAAAVQPQTPRAGPRLLYPFDKTTHSGPIGIMVASPSGAAGPIVTLDGRSVKLARLRFAESWMTPGALTNTARRLGERNESDLWVGEATAKPGRRALTVGGTSASLFVGKAPPKGWGLYRVHPPVPDRTRGAKCSGCHEPEAGALGRAATPASCSPCHTDLSVQTIHKHVTPPLARCAMCHDPHGSVRPSLLTDAKEKLCTRCHAAGHSKG